MSVNSKSTKAELLQHITELELRLAHAEAARPVPFKQRLVRFADELVALVKDTYALGAFCRKGFDQGVDVLLQPVLVKR